MFQVASLCLVRTLTDDLGHFRNVNVTTCACTDVARTEVAHADVGHRL